MAPHEPGPPKRPETAGASDFAAIVNEHWTGVYRLLYSLTGNSHDTEDLTQETFLRALNRLDSFQRSTRMRSWLLRIATNAFFDVRRKRRRVGVGPLEHDPRAWSAVSVPRGERGGRRGWALPFGHASRLET